MDYESKNQRISHFKCLLIVAYANGDMNENEQRFVLSAGRRIGISQEEINEAYGDLMNVENILVPKTIRQKVDYLDNLIFVLLANEVIQKQKIEACKFVALHYDLNPKIIDDLILKHLRDFKDNSITDIVSEVVQELGY